MRKFLFFLGVALTVISCKEDGISLEVQNSSASDINQVICYRVMTGDTVLAKDIIKAGEISTSSLEKSEDRLSYNFILEFTRANGSKETTIETLNVNKDTQSAKIQFIVDETSIKTNCEVVAK
ncbi:MAG: hypothetical protein ACK5IJ_07830 [Mangrovibacterium sp.]